jgi:Flp pilus assembly protein TadD
VSALAGAAEQPTEVLPPPQRAWTAARSPSALREPRATALATVAVAGLLCLATFVAGGGLNLARMTTLELILTLLAGAIAAGAALVLPAGARAYGAWSIGLLFALAALTGLSVAWSVAPDASWQDAGRMLSYAATFAAAAALAWIAPAGWRALLGGVVLAAGAVCLYALLSKVLPNRLDAGDAYARLQAPYGYWNAIGLTAALGAIGFLWLGARRAGHALLSALAYPGMGLMLVTVMLAYSRGALVALAIGVLLWMALVPLRLRGVRVLAVAALAAGPVIAWDFSKPALKDEAVGLAARMTAGHQFGVLLGAMLLVLALAGIAVGFFGDRRAPRAGTRRAAGVAIAVLLALALAGGVGALAASKRGLTGTISHDLSSLTDPNARVPANTAGRLTAVGSVRARYWKEAIQIFEAHPALGAGAAGYETARLRYRTVPIDVRQAHGFVVQTAADLGVAGLALALALLIAWMAAAGRATHPFDRRWSARRPRRGASLNVGASPNMGAPPNMAASPRAIGSRLRLALPALSWRSHPLAYTPERVGLLSMLCVVVTFGVHSFVDWTWYVPGDALVALLCAGWLAGRGSLAPGNRLAPAGSPQSSAAAGSHANGASAAGEPDAASAPPPPRLRRPAQLSPARVAAALAVAAAALLMAWTEWQPQRSVDASEQALALLRRNPTAALSAAQAAVQRDPLSATALFRLAAVQHETGQSALARATLQKAVRMQPSNPETWSALGEYDLRGDPAAAVQELRAAVYLDPQSIPTQNAYVEALRAEQAASKGTARKGAARAGAQKRRRRPLASSSARAPGTPPAPRTSTSAKRKAASRS